MTASDHQPVLSASQALRFIADAGEVLSSSLDYEQTLRRVAVLAVPDFADWCAVYILGEGGEDEAEVSSGHEDPEVEAMLLGIRRARRDRDGASESIEVGESGKSILAGDVNDSLHGGGGSDRLFGAAGNDRVYALDGVALKGMPDVANGGPGRDRFWGDQDDTVREVEIRFG